MLRASYLIAGALSLGHALVHVAGLVGGRLPHHHWWIDLPVVYAPAVLLAVLAVPGVWRRANPGHPPPGGVAHPAGHGPSRRAGSSGEAG